MTQDPSAFDRNDLCTRFQGKPVYHNQDGYYWRHGGYFASLQEVCDDIVEYYDDSDERVYPRPSDTESLGLPGYVTER